MKKIIGPVLALCMITSCSDDKLSREAEILYSFMVTSEVTGREFNSVIEDNSIVIKVSPLLDAEEELSSAVPKFYLSKGATVSPDPGKPQDFTREEGVVYTVTAENGQTQRSYVVTWGISDPMAYGEGFNTAEAVEEKLFTELGYPGEYGNTGLSSLEYGDMHVYHAYCGDYIVLLSRVYIDTVSPTSEHAIKTVDKTTLDPGPSLNLGSISATDLKVISSDYYGRCVGLVVKGGTTEFFYWTSPISSPVSVGSIGVDMASTTDGSANFQVAGDITGDAWITALAPRGVDGNHYRIRVSGGRLASSYSTVSTGYSSGDSSGFQMISPLDDSDEPSFIVGDGEGDGNGSVRCYIHSFSGQRTSTMPAFWNNTFVSGWWIQTGSVLSRTGGRSPVVSGMFINGKSYALVTTGNNNYFAAAVLTDDLQELTHDNLNITSPYMNPPSRNWGYGDWADWYWDEENSEGHLAIWIGRRGLRTYKLICYE
ncbi:MAG: DUF5018 domain-containing protein [Alistipes sp.]|nr:DUF5018 domain-containing protein [Alistipes sp.]